MKRLAIISICLMSAGTAQSMNQAPGFSIHNKSNKRILVEVKNNIGLFDKMKAAVMTEAVEMAVDAFYDKKIDITKKTEVVLYAVDTKQPVSKATFSPNKTIFINWDGQKIYPQRGPLKGLTGKTDKGYSLKNNVSARDIALVPLR